jgi:hypothetical protein
MSYDLADLPGPRLVVQVGADELTIALEGDLPCPIPVSSAVEGELAGVPLALRQGSIHGTGMGAACLPTVLTAPRAAIPAGPVALTVHDGRTTWEIALADVLAERALVPTGPVAPGGTLEVEVSPASDRWIPDPAGAAPTALLLTSRAPQPDSTAEFESPVPATPGPRLALEVPAAFCSGPAFVALSTSARRSAVQACPEGVTCRFDPGGFAAVVEVVPAAPPR